LAAVEIVQKQDPTLHCEHHDLAGDGSLELSANCYPFHLEVDLARGGTLKEWDYLPGKCNLVNVMTRREEAYHEKLRVAAAEGKVVTPEMPEWRKVETIHADTVRAKELGLEHLLFRDWYRRGAFIDHFLRDDARLSDFRENHYPEEGDFVNLPYAAFWKTKDAMERITLVRDGHVWVYGEFLPVRMTKELLLRQGESAMEGRYQIQNLSSSTVTSRFGVETCSGLFGHLSLHDTWYSSLEIQESQDVSHYLFASGGTAPDAGPAATDEALEATRPYLSIPMPDRVLMHVRLSQPATLWHFPLEPVVMSEAGYEKAYQGMVLLHLWNLNLPPHAFWEVAFDIKILTQ